MLQAWKDVGVITYAGYILGFPNDTPEKIARPALKRVQADESAKAYADLALSPSTDAEQDEMDLIQMFKGAIREHTVRRDSSGSGNCGRRSPKD